MRREVVRGVLTSVFRRCHHQSDDFSRPNGPFIPAISSSNSPSNLISQVLKGNRFVQQ